MFRRSLTTAISILQVPHPIIHHTETVLDLGRAIFDGGHIQLQILYSIFPHTEAAFDFGEAVFDFGEAVLNFGEAVLDFGEAVFDFGEAVFDFGEAVFDFGEAVFDFGEAVLDFGEAVLDDGKLRLQVAYAFFDFGEAVRQPCICSCRRAIDCCTAFWLAALSRHMTTDRAVNSPAVR